MVDALGVPHASQVEAAFAHRMLLTGLRAPEARSPMAARTLAGLIGLLAAEGADREVARWLAPTPGGEATFDVLVDRDVLADRGGAANRGGPADRAPTSEPTDPPAGNGLGDEPPVLTGLAVGRALREASRLAAAGPRQVTVIAVGSDGLRRIALERDPSQPFRFVYPEATAYEGELAAVRAAVEEWAALAADPAGSQTGADPLGVSSNALTEAVREALADVMVEVDMVAVEQMVTDALHSALSADNRYSQAGPSGPSGWAGQAALVAAADQFHVVLESFNDRIRAGSRSLQSLADELAAQDRTTAAYTDQLAKSVQTSLDRLTRHLDQRFDDLQRTPAPSPKEPVEPGAGE